MVGCLESDVKAFAKSILLDLEYIHKKGYAHLDINPDNISKVRSTRKTYVAAPNSKANRELESMIYTKSGQDGYGTRWRQSKESYHAVADDIVVAGSGNGEAAANRFNRLESGSVTRFEVIVSPSGLTDRWCLEGTPRYMSPEAIAEHKKGPACDIWALGCVVVEMLCEQSTFSIKPGESLEDFLDRIGFGGESPRIPVGISREAQDFLKRCFVRNSKSRWNASTLLSHPFLKDHIPNAEEYMQYNMESN
ncbi:hypothetical protein Syun_008644 [Stephania yunnanensis]|uniref:Protein kinase domain-containing protein n=1 Tax=Stephania yunnanensis TaxID=152371 RepID=A0AAP0KE65_9MAGN